MPQKDIHDRLKGAFALLAATGRQPLRLWLARDDRGALLMSVKAFASIIDLERCTRYQGIPVTLDNTMMGSRLVADDGSSVQF